MFQERDYIKKREDEGFSLYLHSLSEFVIFTENKPSAFSNLIKPEIHLPISTDYEICLANIFIDKYYYSLVKDDEESSLKLYAGLFSYDDVSQKMGEDKKSQELVL